MKQIIKDIEKAARAAPGLAVKRVLKTKIELHTSSGYSISFHQHPANMHIEVWDGKSWWHWDSKTYKKTKSLVKPTNTYEAKASRKIVYNDEIKSIAFKDDLIILNEWIALKAGV